MSDTTELNYDPLEIVRYIDGPKVFGLKASALKAKIEAKEIPVPMPLSDTGRALGWTRQTIMDHHARMEALAEERAKIMKLKQTQPPALAAVHRVKKVKLRPPVAKQRQRETA
jgi:hypothetical protein